VREPSSQTENVHAFSVWQRALLEVMKLLTIAVAAFAATIVGPAAAQKWPARSVRLIVPYPAGGNVGTVARIVADKLQARLG
jgi:tripartite-type tricarboxylate transporter receptor subunit TctC